MLRYLTKIGPAVLVAAAVLTGSASRSVNGQDINDYEPTAQIDRYLDAEIWTNHSDGEYYEGDNVVIHFRVNRDAFIAIYAIDTRGRVNLLFPTDPTDDNFFYGGVTYSLPGGDDDYDLAITGPEGLEHLQIIASRERFPIPSWYHNSGLVFEGDDVADYMDYLNNRHFVRYGGQRFAFDRAVIFVNEWEPYYYRPIYYPAYPAWSVYGNAYIDYPYGGSVYINGIYWGCAPLYIPRILVGWHTVTIYDHYGHCWESDFHVSRYNTIVFDHTVVKTNVYVTSKYASVRKIGYRDPVKSGYTNFKMKAVKSDKTTASSSVGGVASKTVRGKSGSAAAVAKTEVAPRKYVRGSTKLVKTSRGFETESVSPEYSGKSKVGNPGGTKAQYNTRVGAAAKSSVSSRSGGSMNSGGKAKSAGSSGYYQKKTGGSGKAWSGKAKSSGSNKTATSGKSSKTAGKATKISTPRTSSGKSKSSGGSSAKVSTPKSSEKSGGKATKAGSSSGPKSSAKSAGKSSGSRKSGGR